MTSSSNAPRRSLRYAGTLLLVAIAAPFSCGGSTPAVSDAADVLLDMARGSDASAAIDMASMIDSGGERDMVAAVRDLSTVDVLVKPMATGEDCASAINLAAGQASYMFSATKLDRLTGSLLNGAGCTPTAVLSGPDIAFRYVAAANGFLQIKIDAVSDFAGGQFRVAGLITEACEMPVIDGPGACFSDYAEMPGVMVKHAAVAGRTYYLWVAKTDSSPNTFAGSKVTVTVTEF